MKANNLNGKAPGGERQKLSEKLPLSTPYVIQVFPVYACNFQCEYCLFSINKEYRDFITDKNILDIKLYKKFIDDCLQFEDKIKVIRFVGIGEPLLHKDIVEMVSYTKEKEVCNIIEIITNGSLLTEKMTDDLIEAGLDRLIISLQGTSAKQYKNVSNITLNFESFLQQIEYFYNNKKSCRLYLKIADVALDNEEDKNKFYTLFGNICDDISIEHIVPLHDIDFLNTINKEDQLTQFGLPIKNIKCCSQPFYHCQLNPDGKIVPCYSWNYPVILGDCNIESIYDIWHGKLFNKFRYSMLSKGRDFNTICKECTMSVYRYFKEDDLDYDRFDLRSLYE